MKDLEKPWKVLAIEGLEPEGLQILNENGNFFVNAGKLSREELLKVIPSYDVLIVRSGTKVDEELIERGANLIVIARAGAGYNNIDVDAATRRGILVQNVPGGNSNAVAELVTGYMILLARDLFRVVYNVKLFLWNASKTNGIELKGKTIGIVGLGRIGSLVAQKAQAFNMRTIAYDPYKPDEWFQKFCVERIASLEPLVAQSDFITVHTPLTPETNRMFSMNLLQKCKRGCFLINAARGGIVNEAALIEAVNAGIVQRAALDVLKEENEERLNRSVIQHPRIYVSSHRGGSTVEARAEIAREVAEGIILFLEKNRIKNAVSVPYLPEKDYDHIKPYRVLTEKLTRFLTGVCSFSPAHVELRVSPRYQDAASVLKQIVARAFICKDVSEIDRQREYIRALTRVQEELAIQIECNLLEDNKQNEAAIEISFRTQDMHMWVRGELIKDEPWVTAVNGSRVESRFTEGRWMIYYENEDVPGVVHKVSGILYKYNINMGSINTEDESDPIAINILRISHKGNNEALFETHLDAIRKELENLVSRSVVSCIRIVKV